MRFLGDKSVLSEKLRNKCIEIEEMAPDREFICNLALNYGGRDEIVNAVKKIVASGVAPEMVTEELISQNLYTVSQPDPDYIIRPSGEYRLSNYLIWQSAYAEYWFSDVLWPDFSPKHLEEALDCYAKRNRRFGGV